MDLTPAAAAVLDILKKARQGRMSAGRISSHLKEQALHSTVTLLWDMRALGLVTRDTNAGHPSRHVWRLTGVAS